MDEFILWTSVVGGTPFALALVQRAAEWLHDAMRTRMLARTSAARKRQMRDSSQYWMHV